MSRDLGIPLMVQRSTLTMLVALTLIGCEGANPNTSSAQARTLPPAPAKPVGPVPAQTVDASRRTAITTAAERVAPAVVTVQTETVQKVPVDFFEYFMGGRTGERRNAGIGSGFIVRSDGIIVTNAHVISGATKVSIGLRDGTSYDATVVGIDETNDLAVVRIKATNLPVAPLGSSATLIVGEWSIAIAPAPKDGHKGLRWLLDHSANWACITAKRSGSLSTRLTFIR